MPAYEAIKEEEARLKKERASGVGTTARAPARLPVPSFLPFSAWAAASPALQATLIADDPATRRKARLSWYHPCDGMGLLVTGSPGGSLRTGPWVRRDFCALGWLRGGGSEAGVLAPILMLFYSPL